MIKPINNLPEHHDHHEQLRTRSWLVDGAALEAETALYGEFGGVWGAQTAAAGSEARPLHMAEGVIDRTFLRVNAEVQSERLASDRALNDAQLRVSEAFDELSP